ncbi:MAG: sigma 54-interacting transcriptional regulator [Candidatus Krumholzibacteriota bacterium]|nr:sigma 54-interacting transcriptional regulator [Candidatus Krumholzibacteriota bacterium]
MNRKDGKQDFISRYTVKTRLAGFPDWNGFEVTDSLSGRDYLLFDLKDAKAADLSLSDLKMRDHLFSRRSEFFPATLSLQENSEGVFFLLSYEKISSLADHLSRIGPTKALSTLKALLSDIISTEASGLFFNDLSPGSVIVIDDSPVILPISFLLPGEIISRESFSARTREFDPLINDLNGVGELLHSFKEYLPPESSSECARLAEKLSSLSSEVTRDEYYGLITETASFLDLDEKDIPPYFLKKHPGTPYLSEMERLGQITSRAREGRKQMVLIEGADGEGKSSFLEEALRNIKDRWDFNDGRFLSDQDICGDLAQDEDSKNPVCMIIDTSIQEPIFYSQILKTLSAGLDRWDIAIISIGEDATGPFRKSLQDEGRSHDFHVNTLELPALDNDRRREIIADALPDHLKEEFNDSAPAGMTISFYGLFSRALAMDSAGTDRKKTVKSLIDDLTPEERSVLDFIAAFRFRVPLSVLKTIYSTEEKRFYEIVQRLISLGLLSVTAERSILLERKLSLCFSIGSRNLAEKILDLIPATRKKELHRNIAHILRDNRNTPLAYTFYHLVACCEDTEASFKGMEIFHHLLEIKSINAINCFNEYFMKKKLARHLPPEMHFKLYLELGDYFSLIGMVDKAEQLYRKCREETTRNGEWYKLRALATKAVRRECDILEKRGEFKKAESLLKSALDMHGEHILASERAKLYNDLAWVHYRLGQLDESWENCLIVHKIVDKKQHPRELSESLSLMGAINWNRSKYEDALDCHKRCLVIREECNDEQGVGATYNNLALVYRSMGRIKEALDNFTKSMKIKDKSNNLPGLAIGHLNLALAYMDLEEIEKSEKSCDKARLLAEDLGNQQLLAEIFGTLGEIYYLKGDKSSAREYYFKDLHICHTTKSIREKAIVFRRLGDLSLTEGKLTEATELLNQAKELNNRIGSRLETILLDLLEGRILLAEGKREIGRMKLEGTSFELSLLGRKTTASSVTAEIGELYLDEGNEHLAREYLLRSISLIGESERLPKQVRQLQDNLEEITRKETGQIHTDSSRFRALCRVISFIRTIREPKKLYDTITESAKNITGMERAALILQNENHNSFRIISSIGEFEGGSDLTDNDIIAILNISRQLGYPLDISRSNIPEGKVGKGFLKRHPGIICTPLWIQDEMTGFLYLDSRQKVEETSDEEHSFLVAFSQQIALGMEGILLETRLKELEKSQVAMTPVSVPGLKKRVTFKDVVGKSPAIRQVFELVESIKDMDTAILLTGPNGSGKDLIAKAIHSAGPRGSKPFHHINCAAFPRDLLESELFGHERGSFTSAHKQSIGHFEKAKGSTIYLNEIAEIPLPLQSKLLRVLEEQVFFRVGGNREIDADVRIITATNRDLKKMVGQGTFREDLYYRINVFPIRIPPLSERREDIPLLCDHFLNNLCRLYNIPTKKISPEAMTYLIEYDWQGNVRELENMIKRMIIISKKDTILPEDLPENILEHTETVHAQALSTLEDVVLSLLDNLEYSASDPILPKVEGSIIRKVVEKTGDKQKAAKLLGISKPTLYARLKKYE